jgi:hypothetical protein
MRAPKINLQKLLTRMERSKIDVRISMRVSKWSLFRVWLGLRITALGLRITGLPIEFNSEVIEDGTDKDQKL